MAVTLDANAVAALLNCDYKTVIAKAAKGEIPAAKFGRAWAFLRTDIEAYIAAEIKKQTEARKPPPVPTEFVKRRGRPRTRLLP